MQFIRKNKVSILGALVALLLACALPGLTACSGNPYSTDQIPSSVSYSDQGKPDFGDLARQTESFEEYSSLDVLGRCGPATACIGRDLMPTKERGQISSIKPTGWQRAEYDFIDGGLLYNRCHLIAYSLTAEDLNERNLITGTRQMNLAMTEFEKLVCSCVEDTGNHVLYRVTPMFEGVELVARGVRMEALSVEDGGEAICFNVYIPNEQDGVGIDYLTGFSWPLDEMGDEATRGDDSGTDVSQGIDSTYVLNTSSKRFHLPTCDSVSTISAKNKAGSDKSRNELIAEGYKPCGSCNP